MHKYNTLLEAISDVRTILQASTACPTQCKDLVANWPDFIGIVDASSHGMGGSSHWGTFRNTPHGILFTVARGNTKGSGILRQPQWQNHELRPRNGRISAPLASLRSVSANALSLSGYSKTQIQKMGRWHGATFKENIREELACYARNMSRDMK